MIGDDEHPGLYFSSVDSLFEGIQERRKVIEYDISVSIVEIYNESLRDLLTKKNGIQVKLRDNGEGETISDQVVKSVTSKNQIL
jgi:kinesin family protein C2/C3